MAWNNIIPASVLREMMDSMEKQYLLELDCPPLYTIDEKYLTSCNVAYSYINPDGTKGGTHSTVDHPAFAALRKHLSYNEYIQIPTYPCVNGDRVLKPFYLNDVYFGVGEQFLSASPMHWKLNSK